MILAFIHQKGGTGKSTLAIASAMWLARRGRTVIVLDIDRQLTSDTWGRKHGKKHGVSVRAQVERQVSEAIEELTDLYDDILLDLPPTVTPHTEQAIEAADLLVIPMRPTQPDLWALDRLIALVMLSNRQPPPPYRVVFSQCGPEDQTEACKTLALRRIEPLEDTIPYSREWQSIFSGEGLTEDMDKIIGSILNALPLPDKLQEN